MTPEEKEARRQANVKARRAEWESLSEEQRQTRIRAAADGRLRSEAWRRSLAVSKYRMAGVPEDDIEALMQMPQSQRKWARKRFVLYGLRPTDAARMWAEQDGKCALCSADLSVVGSHVDHDHATLQVRGLLCVYCNLALGHVEARGTAWVARAIDYMLTKQGA